jgi:hypothetical protein
MILRFALVLSVLLAFSNDVGAQNSPLPGQWSQEFGYPGFDDAVNAVATASDGSTYFGGTFRHVGTLPCHGVARFGDGEWSCIGAGLFVLEVNALAVTSDGDIIAGGRFEGTGGNPIANIARWDGEQWHSLGEGIGGDVNTIAISDDGEIYVGGRFGGSGDVTLRHVARWDGTRWRALGSGLSLVPAGLYGAQVFSIALDHNGDLVVTGEFNRAGGQEVGSIARWDGAAWHDMGEGLSRDWFGATLGIGRGVLIDANGDVVAGGDFSGAGGVSTHNAARWNGEAWSAVSADSIGAVTALALTSEGSLIAAATGQIVRLESDSWVTLTDNVGGHVRSMAPHPTDGLVLAGSFSRIGASGMAGAAHWDGEVFHPFHPHNVSGFDHVTVIIGSIDGQPVVAGPFGSAGLNRARHIARWTGTSWEDLEFSHSPYFDFIPASGPDGRLVIAWGNRVFEYVDFEWKQLPGHFTGGNIQLLSAFGADGIYVAGGFSAVDDQPVNRLARWDGTSWHPVGGGPNHFIFSLAASPTGELYVSGTFTEVDGINVDGGAHWDGERWHRADLRAGEVHNHPYLKFSPAGELYGAMESIGISRWNQDRWETIPDLPSGHFASFTFDADGQIIALPRHTNEILIQRDDAWHRLQTEANGSISSLYVDPDGTLHVAGDFTHIGGVAASRYSQWTAQLPTSIDTEPRNRTRIPVQQPFPNPASYTAHFVVDMDGTAPVTVDVYDMLGRRAMQHAMHLYGTGQQRIELDVSGLSAGVYVVRVRTGSLVETVLITVAR